MFRYSFHQTRSVDGSGPTLTPTVERAFELDLPRTIAVLEAGAAIAEGADTYLDVWRSERAEYLADMAGIEAQYAAEWGVQG